MGAAVRDEYLPKWLTNNLKSTCECGAEREDYYNEQERITKRLCANPVYCNKFALKIVGLCDILQVKEIGEATAKKIVKSNKPVNHYANIPYIIKNKPVVDLYTYIY